jgi:hypothetical protein
LNAISHKKHVLCGSPFIANANEAEVLQLQAPRESIMEGRICNSAGLSTADFVHQECGLVSVHPFELFERYSTKKRL